MDDARSRGSTQAGVEAVGTMLLLVSAVAFSATGYFTRVAPVAPVAMIFWRNLFGGVGLTAVLLARRSHPLSELRRLTWAGWAAVACSAGSMICYLAAFAYTSVANISIIYAMAPMVTAVLAWVALGERPAPRTLAAAGLAVAGVAITMAGSGTSVSLLGDGLALLMTAGLSIVAVLTRGRRLPPLPTALASALTAAVAVLPLAAMTGVDLGIGGQTAIWLAGFGLVTMTLAWPLSLAGTARVPAARAMLISAFELPLAPLWVWLGFGEAPSPAALVGGTLVFAAVLWEVAAGRISRTRPVVAAAQAEQARRA